MGEEALKEAEGVGLEDERVVVVAVRLDGEAVVMLVRLVVFVCDIVLVECVVRVVVVRVVVAAAEGEAPVLDFFRS